jgi:plastocyanin
MTEQPPKDLWTQFLDWLAQIITPDWDSVIGWLPLITTVLVVLVVFLMLPYAWWRARPINRPRLAPRLPPPPPEGVHLPGPSRWPFVVPIGGALILLALAIRPTDQQGQPTAPVNWPVLLVGLLVTFVALAGWLRDAMREWRRVEGAADDHKLLTSSGAAVARLPAAGITTPTLTRPGHAAEAGAIPVDRALVPAEPAEPGLPPGIHLPGPSPWPFLAPIGVAVIFFGLVFSPVLLLAGLVMSLIAAAGWIRDAGFEYRQVEEGHPAEPRTRDPERAFPKRLVGLYVAILGLAFLAMAAPGLVAFANPAPSASPAPSGPAGGGGGPPPAVVQIAAKDVAFDKTALEVPADTPITIEFDNQEALPHNVAIFADDSLSTALFTGDVVTGPTKVTYNVDPLPAGAHPFICSVHPNMKGTITAR